MFMLLTKRKPKKRKMSKLGIEKTAFDRNSKDPGWNPGLAIFQTVSLRLDSKYLILISSGLISLTKINRKIIL